MASLPTEYRVRKNHSENTWRVDEKILMPTQRSYKLMWVINENGFLTKKDADDKKEFLESAQTKDYSALEKKVLKFYKPQEGTQSIFFLKDISTQGTVTGRSSCKHHNLGTSPSRDTDYEMSENEIYARDYLTDCEKNSINPNHMCNKIVLTDEECYHMSQDFIYSYSDIRIIFKSPIEFIHKTSPTRRRITTGPSIQDIPREHCKIIKKGDGKLAIADSNGFKEDGLVQIAGVSTPKRIKRITK